MSKDNCVLRWNGLLLHAVRKTAFGPPAVARAIALVHTAMFDAWAHFDSKAMPVRTPIPQRAEARYRSDESRQRAMSYAAYRVLCDLFPKAQFSMFEALMREYGYDPKNTHQNGNTPECIGNRVAEKVLEFAHEDNSNQQINYGDPSGSYDPVNTVKDLHNINHWRPLGIKLPDGTVKGQEFLYPHWGLVEPFAVNPQAIKPPKPFRYPRPLPVSSINELNAEEQEDARIFEEQCRTILEFSRDLDDTTKSIAEYWKDGPGSVTPSGHWCLLARYVSLRDRNKMGQDVKMFFALGNAVSDAGIASWYGKVYYDFCRPVTAVRSLLEGTEINAWAGPYVERETPIAAEKWEPYLSPTPPFGEYVSGHSTFSAAAAEVLKSFTGSDYFGMSVTIPAGSSLIEPGMVPASDIVLSWRKFSEAAQQAGISRCYGGIHFIPGNEEGLKLGRLVGKTVWNKVQKYFDGSIADDPDYC